MIIEHKPGCTWSSLPMDGAPTCQCGALAAAWNRRVAPASGGVSERDKETARLLFKSAQCFAEMRAISVALNAADDSNLASLAETMMAQRRLLAEYIAGDTLWDEGVQARKLAHSILADEPAPADGEREAMRERIMNHVMEVADEIWHELEAADGDRTRTLLELIDKDGG